MKRRSHYPEIFGYISRKIYWSISWLSWPSNKSTKFGCGFRVVRIDFIVGTLHFEVAIKLIASCFQAVNNYARMTDRPRTPATPSPPVGWTDRPALFSQLLCPRAAQWAAIQTSQSRLDIVACSSSWRAHRSKRAKGRRSKDDLRDAGRIFVTAAQLSPR
jgi:hypothetical protein